MIGIPRNVEMNEHLAEQVLLSLTSGCLLTALARGSQPARTLTALIPGNRMFSTERAMSQDNPSTRPFMGIHLCDGRSYVLPRQSMDSSRYETYCVDSVNSLKTSNEMASTKSRNIQYRSNLIQSVQFIPKSIQ